MNINKKSQLKNWFVALMLIMFVSIAYYAVTPAFRYIDDQYGTQINLTTSTHDAQNVVSTIRMYWRVWPVIVLASLILWAFFSSLKQDPNYPVQ